MPESAMFKGRQSSGASFLKSDYYQMIRSQIDAENQLSNMRVIWLLIAEAFLVGGYATLLNAQEQGKNKFFAFQQDLLFWALPIAGLFAAFLALSGVLASTKRVAQFQEFYEMYEQKIGENDDSTESYPPLQDDGLIRRMTSISLMGLPALFVGLWAMVFVAQMVHRLLASS